MDRAESPATSALSVAELRERLEHLSIRDAHLLGRELDRAKPNNDLAKLDARIASAEALIARRAAALPDITYPADLPVVARRDDLADAIAKHQVVIVAGDTGSGKSTQLPKICLELGRGQRGLIGHTQPRRLAARTVAERVATELNSELGNVVGFAVRFADKVRDTTMVKVMTDGILLAEIQRDRDLLRYDTIIVDEAHERSLNVDFLLGYLTRLLSRRRDLKVIVTSATIDTQRFADHFASHLRIEVPVIEVSGRMHPVEIRYRPFGAEAEAEAVAESVSDDRDQNQAIVDAVDELCKEGPGDILVFLSGEREIRDAADALKTRDSIEVLPLYARLSLSEQQRIFKPHRSRRVVLATNVAETSLTVPGIRYVIDTGTARISRYSKRLKVQQLPIEEVSQASANQRSGRCGRIGPGIAIRLYAEENFAKRDPFTEPEILRTNLASVVLSMAAFGFGTMATFPFVEAPESQSIRDGVTLLHELGAFDDDERLTAVGRRMARLPLDPRLARMVLEADKRGCVREITILTAALSIQDPRERPAEHRGAADEFHKRFADEHSDFISLLNLWEYVRTQQRDLSGNQFRKRCKAEYINHLRVREWQDIFSQLRQVIRELDISLGVKGAHHDNIHQALLAGLLTHIGQRDDDSDTDRNTKERNDRKAPAKPRGRVSKEFRGVRNSRFAIAPGSTLSRRPPRWVMASEMVETNRLWARTCATIEPAWIETVGAHLIKRTHSEPRWDAKRGAAACTERVLLSGLSVVEGRTIDLARIDATLAREMFIRHALVGHEWRTHHRFVEANRALIDEMLALESRLRRRDVVVNDDALFAFFDKRIPKDVVSVRHFDKWWNKTRQRTPEFLHFSQSDVIDPAFAHANDPSHFPDLWTTPEGEFALRYVYDPAADDDGVTMRVPLIRLPQLAASTFHWHIPGMRIELVSELIRLAPKAARRQLVPAPEYAAEFLQRADVSKALLPQLNAILSHLGASPVSYTTADLEKLAPHLRLRVEVIDGAGNIVGGGRDIAALVAQFATTARTAIANSFETYERAKVDTWDIGDLPERIEANVGGQTVHGYPALVDEGRNVALRVLSSKRAQDHAMWLGTQALLGRAMGDVAKQIKRNLNASTSTVLALSRHGDVGAIINDCITSSVELLLARQGGPVRSADAYEQLRTRVEREIVAIATQACRDAGVALDRHDAIQDRLAPLTATAYDDAVVDITSQLLRIMPDSFVLSHGVTRLGDIGRYLEAIERRIDKLIADPTKDREKMVRIVSLERQCNATPDPGTVVRVRWMLEELRVSVFAQQVGTNGPISEERIRKELARAS